MIALIVIRFVFSALAALVVMLCARRHAQRYAANMPQLGGAGVFLGMGLAWLAAVCFGDLFNVGWPARTSGLVLLCIAPAMLGGIAEDVTLRLSVCAIDWPWPSARRCSCAARSDSTCTASASRWSTVGCAWRPGSRR